MAGSEKAGATGKLERERSLCEIWGGTLSQREREREKEKNRQTGSLCLQVGQTRRQADLGVKEDALVTKVDMAHGASALPASEVCVWVGVRGCVRG